MKPISSRMLCERLGIVRPTLNRWMNEGCPKPPITIYHGPKSKPTGLAVRMWTAGDIQRLKRWAGSRLFARGASAFRRRGNRIDKIIDQACRKAIADEAIRLVQLDEPNIDATTIRTAMKRNPDFERVVAGYRSNIRAKLAQNDGQGFVN